MSIDIDNAETVTFIVPASDVDKEVTIFLEEDTISKRWDEASPLVGAAIGSGVGAFGGSVLGAAVAGETGATVGAFIGAGFGAGLVGTIFRK